MSRPPWYQSDFLPSDGDPLTPEAEGLALNGRLASVQAPLAPVQCLHAAAGPDGSLLQARL